MTGELNMVMVVMTAGKTCMNKQNHSLLNKYHYLDVLA